MFKFPNEVPIIGLIEVSKEATVEYREILGSFVEPKLGETCRYASYEVMKGKGLLSLHEGSIKGKAKIHGIKCFECVSTYNNLNDGKKYEVISFNRIHDSHVQSLAYIEEYPNGTREFYTFKDDHFNENWGIGKNNEGLKIQLRNRGLITANGNEISTQIDESGQYDLVGEYRLKIDHQVFEVFRLIFIAHENQVSDFFIDKNGKEIMHRFFIPDEGFGGKMKETPYSQQYPLAYVLKLNNRNCICSTIEIADRINEKR